MSGRSGVADGDVADGGLPRRNIKQLAAPNKCWPCQHRQKALHEKAVRNRTNIRTGPSSQVPQMLQSLLADRFHLAFHHETRTVSAYELLAAKNGPVGGGEKGYQNGGEVAPLPGGAIRSEPFPLLRSVVRNGPEPSRARRCWARRSE